MRSSRSITAGMGKLYGAFSVATEMISPRLKLGAVTIPELYHYTDQAGLLGIVRCNSLWATNALFLNDSREVLHGFKVGSDAISQSLATAEYEPFEKALADLKSYLDYQLRPRDKHSGLPEDRGLNPLTVPHVVCFCADRDSLSQWRAYSSGEGYAIGFNFNVEWPDLHSPTDGRKWFFQKVLYEPQEQTKTAYAILSAVQMVANEVAENKIDLGDYPPDAFLYTLLASFLLRRLFAFKDYAFRSEDEWRLMLDSPALLFKFPFEALKFRASKIGVAPYFDARPNGAKKLPISRVICGPTLDPDVAEKGVELLLQKCGFRDIDVSSSPIPLRAG